MNVDEFRRELEAEVRNENFNSGQSPSAAFAQKITEYMREAEYLNGDFRESYFEGKHPNDRRKNLRVDGWLQDEADNSIVLFVVHYGGGNEAMTKTLAEDKFKLLETFTEAAISNALDVEESTSTAELVDTLRDNPDEKIKFILLTNARRSIKLNDIKNFFVRGKAVECQLWDIERIFDVYTSMQVREAVTINFGDGLPCLHAAKADDCESFLCVLPGNVLADIYDEYGSRLLEGNVRSFLSTKGAVNKKIRATILNQPKMFFAFNNGIAATAKSLELKKFGGELLITSATDFQIVNGGQTTALLLNARFKDKASLEKVFVQMKLTRIGDMPVDAQEKLIGEIAKSSNSQNKVSDADFFSTHPFHVEMEKISRRIFAPPHGGIQQDTHWFYERARGQYVQEQFKMTPTQRKNFQRVNPKSQVMTKTDFAKFRMSWDGNPDIVSKGAQANFARFADEISSAWTKNPVQFNEHYFKETVALAIMFRNVEAIVSAQDWYKRTKSFRANIVTYSLAIFRHALKEKFPNAELNLLELWRTQEFPDDFRKIFTAITFQVNEFITDPGRAIQNVTQWCKQSGCWERMKLSLSVELPQNFSRWMIGRKELREQKTDAVEIQTTSFELDMQRKVLSFSGMTWRRIRDDASKRKLLFDESKALSKAMKHEIQPIKDCKKLLQLLDRLEENGLTYAPDMEP